MSFHVPENWPTGLVVGVTAPRAIGGPTLAVANWPAGWTAFRKIATVIRANTIVGHIELAGYSGGLLTVSGGAEGDADFAQQVGDQIWLNPTAGSILELQAAITTAQAAITTAQAAIAALQALESTTVYTSGSYNDPAWIAHLAGSKVTGNIPGDAAGLTAPIAESQVTGLVADLAARALDSAAVHTTGNETIAGTKTFTAAIAGSITGSAATATNGVVTTGSYADPAWITALAGSKVTGNIAGAAAGLTAPIAESQVTGLVADLAAKQAAGSYAVTSNNLSDLASASTARTNLGLGTAAVHASGDFIAAPFASDALATATQLRLAAWGDSLTYGQGGTSYPAQLEPLVLRSCYQGGVSGQTSTQVRTRMVADTARANYAAVIWVGRNNVTQPATIQADIAAMVAALGHTRYLVLAVTNSSAEPSGTTNYNTIVALNAALASTYGGRFFDVRTYLVSQYNPAIPQDVTDHSNDVPPSSLRSDTTHLTTAGYGLVAAQIAARVAGLKPPDAPLTANNLGELLASPAAPLGIAAPSSATLTALSIVNPDQAQFPANTAIDVSGSLVVEPYLFEFASVDATWAMQLALGDTSTSLGTGFGLQLGVSAWWGIVLSGNREGAPYPLTAGSTSDPSVTILGTNVATPTLLVRAPSGQTGDIFQINKGATNYGTIDASGLLNYQGFAAFQAGIISTAYNSVGASGGYYITTRSSSANAWQLFSAAGDLTAWNDVLAGSALDVHASDNSVTFHGNVAAPNLGTASAHATADFAPAARDLIRFADDFSRYTNGDIVGQVPAIGAAWQQGASGTPNPLHATVAAGLLGYPTASYGSDSYHTCYPMADLGAGVVPAQVWADVVWGAANVSGEGLFLISNVSPLNLGGITHTIHYAFTNATWTFQIWDGGGSPVTVATGNFQPPLTCDGVTRHRFGLAVTALGAGLDSATLYLPDGNTHVVTDAQVHTATGSTYLSTCLGRYVIWESFLQTATDDVRYARVAALGRNPAVAPGPYLALDDFWPIWADVRANYVDLSTVQTINAQKYFNTNALNALTLTLVDTGGHSYLWFPDPGGTLTLYDGSFVQMMHFDTSSNSYNLTLHGGLSLGGAISATNIGGAAGHAASDFATSLAPTAVKTAAYTAAAGDLVPVDTTAGAVPITLPTAPADRSRVAVKMVIQGGSNTVTINCGGSDVFNKAGGPTSATLTLVNQAIALQYRASGAIWYVVSDDLPLSQLDLRYAQLANNLSDVTAATARTNLGLGTAGTHAATDFAQSISLTTPSVLYTTPVTWTNTAGAFAGALTLNTQSANTVLAGPTSGAAATPTMRALVAADIPDVSATYLKVANNLSDVTAATARTNLAVPGTAVANTFTAAQTITPGSGATCVTLNPASGGTSFLLTRVGTGAGNGQYWSYGFQNAANTDVFLFGCSSSTYTTGGSLGWIGNSQAFLYFPSSLKFGTGAGSTAVLLMNSSGLTIGDGMNLALGTTTGTKIGTATTQKIGFFNSAPIVQPTVTGSRGGNAALASLLTALANLGLVVDSSTA